MKYAIAQTSGKQFLVKPGEWYDIDFIKKGEVGDYIYLNKILFFRNENKIQIGTPFLTEIRISSKRWSISMCLPLKDTPKKLPGHGQSLENSQAMFDR